MRSKGGDNGQHKINPILVIYHYFLGLQWKILTLLSNLPIIIIIINIIIDWQLLVFMPSVYGSLGNDNIMDILHMLQSWFCRCFDTARACHYRNMAMFYSLYSKTGMYYFSACISHFVWDLWKELLSNFIGCVWRGPEYGIFFITWLFQIKLYRLKSGCYLNIVAKDGTRWRASN